MKVFKIIFYALLFILFILVYIKNTSKKRIDILVNKDNPLDKDYIPSNLVLIDDKYLKKEAYEAFKKLSNNASKEGYTIKIASAYRDYDYQRYLYNYYVKTYGKDYANRCSAKPGFSEHQTGLAIDVMGSNNDYNLFDEAKEFNWMINNSYKYGFILRYPKNKEDITGFKYEPWHYRYVGKRIAKYIYEHDLTLEEYKKRTN